jgi:very-short-patch-repair endonuclease
VQEVLAKHGFQVDNQVGVAGFFIDLAIVDPEMPGRYLLGLECDGATYHSAPSARERDRLRQEILEAHGWSIHRIWSTDWFQRAKVETDRLLKAIAAAKSSVSSDSIQSENSELFPEPKVAVRRDEPTIGQGASVQLSQPYRQADFVPGNVNMQPHEVPLGSMAYTVERIVGTEGPIHEEEVVARVRDLWGLSRAGSRIQSAVQVALRHAVRKGNLLVEDDFYQQKDAPVVVRDRSDAASRTLKKPELLPPQEIREAIVELVREAHGLRREETATAVSRMLGFQTTSQQLRDRIHQQVELLVSRGVVQEHAEVLTAET